MSYYVAMASLDVYKDQSCCCLLTAGVVDVGLPRQLCTQVGLPRQLFTSSCSLSLTLFLPGSTGIYHVAQDGLETVYNYPLTLQFYANLILSSLK